MEDKSKLSPRQQEVLGEILEYQELCHRPPTVQELADIMGFKSPNAAAEHLKALERKGFISITKGAARGIKVTGCMTPRDQRDEALLVLRELLACSVGSAERAAELLSRYPDQGAHA